MRTVADEWPQIVVRPALLPVRHEAGADRLGDVAGIGIAPRHTLVRARRASGVTNLP
jgi:hypothetical protein